MQPLHRRKIRLEDLQLVLVIRVQLRALLLELADEVALEHLRRCVAATALQTVVRLRLDAVLLGATERSADRLQLLRDQALLVVDIDDLLLLRVGDELLFRILQLDFELLQTVLEEAACIGGRVHAALEIAGDEALGHRVRDCRGERPVAAGELHTHQTRIAHRLDRQPTLEPSQQCGLLHVLPVARVGARLEHADQTGQRRGLQQTFDRRVVGQIELRDNALCERLALQQFVLGLVEILVAWRLDRHQALDLDHLDRIAVDLHGRAGAIGRWRQQGRHQHDHEHDAQKTQHRPAPLEDDVPVLAQIDRVVVGAIVAGVLRQRDNLSLLRDQRVRRADRYRQSLWAIGSVAYVIHCATSCPVHKKPGRPVAPRSRSIDRPETDESAQRVGEALEERATARAVDDDNVVAVD